MIKRTVYNIKNNKSTIVFEEEPPIPIETIQAQKLEELQPLLSQYEAQGMPIANNGNTYHLQCRPTDRVNWLGVITMANMLPSDTDTVTIMTKQNEPITLTKPQVIKAMVDVGLYSQALYGARWAVRSAINAINEKATLEGYDVEAEFLQALQAILA